MDDNGAVLEGYTREVMGRYVDLKLFMLVKPDTDFNSRFRAWDMDAQRYVMINGWMLNIQDIITR
jgi:hypothetical protein